MNVYLVTCKKYFTDGNGYTIAVFSTKGLAVKYLRQNKNIHYNNVEQWYEDDEDNMLYKIEKYCLNEVDNQKKCGKV
jgi:hypothetical protein